MTASDMSQVWLCPRHRAQIWADPDAALALWQLLQRAAGEGRLAGPMLQLARWHVALDIVAALRHHHDPRALSCLRAVACALVPMLPGDDVLLLRLHQQLCDLPTTGPDAIARELAGWLDLLEQRLAGADPRRFVMPSVALC